MNKERALEMIKDRITYLSTAKGETEEDEKMIQEWIEFFKFIEDILIK